MGEEPTPNSAEVRHLPRLAVPMGAGAVLVGGTVVALILSGGMLLRGNQPLATGQSPVLSPPAILAVPSEAAGSRDRDPEPDPTRTDAPVRDSASGQPPVRDLTVRVSNPTSIRTPVTGHVPAAPEKTENTGDGSGTDPGGSSEGDSSGGDNAQDQDGGQGKDRPGTGCHRTGPGHSHRPVRKWPRKCCHCRGRRGDHPSGTRPRCAMSASDRSAPERSSAANRPGPTPSGSVSPESASGESADA
jgi:hypothetical protein